MVRKIVYRFVCICACVALCSLTTCIYVSASADGKDETTTDEEKAIMKIIEDDNNDIATNGDEAAGAFYIPKSRFTTSEDYDEYCKRMYNKGYMDKNGDWTPTAKNFINNQTDENKEALDQNAKEIVEQRVKDGEMSYKDNPYLSYDEMQKIEKEETKEATQQSNGTGTKDNDSLLDNEDTDSSGNSESDTTSSDYEDESDIDADEEDDSVEEPAQQKKGRVFGKIIMVILICGIAIVSYSIYRRQF